MLQAGGDDALIRRRVVAGRWERHESGVYAFPGGAPSFLRRVWCAQLATSETAVVSHQTAAALHRLDGFPMRSCVLTVPHSGWHRINGVFVHQISDLADDDVTAIRSLPVTEVFRTIVDLAPWVSWSRLEAAAEDAVATGKTTFDHIGRCTHRVARRGKPGIRVLTALLDKHGPGEPVLQSALERAADRLFCAAGLPKPDRQVALPGRQQVTGCADFGFADARLLVEVDGRRWHTRLGDLRRDHHRDREVARVGWLTLRLLHEDVVNDAAATADDVRTTYETRRAQFSTH